MNEQTVLANGPIYQPKMKLMPFSGFEGEDFRNFKQTLDNYFALSNINDEDRKLIILKTQLYHAARTFVNKLLKKTKDPLSYSEVMKKLMDQYITPELIQTYEYAFNNMVQGIDEHPRTFYARLFEAAELAEIDSESMIQSRFRAGVHPIIQQHCISLGCKDIDAWLKAAEGYWTAHNPQQVTMADNPFHPRRIAHPVDTIQMSPYQTATNSPSLNAITSTNPLDMKDIQKSIRSIIKEEFNNFSKNQNGTYNQPPNPRYNNPRHQPRQYNAPHYNQNSYHHNNGQRNYNNQNQDPVFDPNYGDYNGYHPSPPMNQNRRPNYNNRRSYNNQQYQYNPQYQQHQTQQPTQQNHQSKN